MLTQRAEEVARHLMPQGKKEGNEWCIGSIHGETGKSLKIKLTGEKAGLWCDFALGMLFQVIFLIYGQIHDKSLSLLH